MRNLIRKTFRLYGHSCHLGLDLSRARHLRLHPTSSDPKRPLRTIGRQSGQSGHSFRKPGSVRPKPRKPADAQAKPTDAQAKPTDVLAKPPDAQAKPADAQVKPPDPGVKLKIDGLSSSHTTYFKFNYINEPIDT